MKEKILPILVAIIIVITSYQIFIFKGFDSDTGIMLKNSNRVTNGEYEKIFSEGDPIVSITNISISNIFNIPIYLTAIVAVLLFSLILTKLTKNTYKKYLIFLFSWSSGTVFSFSYDLQPYGILLLIYSLCVIILKKDNKPKHFFISSFLIAITPLIYPVALLSMIPLGSYQLYKLLKFSQNKKKIAIALSPYIITLIWLVQRVSVAGITKFYNYPNNWYINNALPIVNRDFWGYPIRRSTEYFIELFNNFSNENFAFIFVSVFIIIGFLNAVKERDKAIIALAFGSAISFFAILLTTPSPFTRYMFFIFPILIIFFNKFSIFNLTKISKLLMNSVVIVVLIISISQNITAIDEKNNGLQIEDYESFANVMDIDCHIYSRHQAGLQITKKDTLNIAEFEFEDAKTLLSSDSETEIMQVFEKYDICYVIIYNNIEKWEIDYYSWIEEYEIQQTWPFNFIEMEGSERVLVGEVYTLYEIK